MSGGICWKILNLRKLTSMERPEAEGATVIGAL